MAVLSDHRNRAAAAAWLDWLGEHGRKPLTLHQYGGKLAALCDHVGGRWLGDVDLATLEAFIGRERRGGRKASAATRSRDVTVVRGFYEWLRSHKLIVEDPAADLQGPKVKNSNPKAIDDELWAKVWHSEQLTEVERVYLGLGYFVGLRREEVCRLAPGHVDAKNGRLIHFKRKGDGNDQTTGVVPYLSSARLFAEKRPDLIGVAEDFVIPLERLHKARTGDRWLIPWGEEAAAWRRSSGRQGPPDGMTNPDQLNRRTQRLLARMGLPERIFTPHALRHSYVTKLLEMGVPIEVVSRLANHSSVTVTMRYVKLAHDPLAPFLTGERSLRPNRWG